MADQKRCPKRECLSPNVQLALGENTETWNYGRYTVDCGAVEHAYLSSYQAHASET